MALKKCKHACCDCEHPCNLDEIIPCSPDCENLTPDGKIKVSKCLRAGCENIKLIFGEKGSNDLHLIAEKDVILPYLFL